MKNRAILIPIVILIGIFIGFQYEKRASKKSTKVIYQAQERGEVTELRTPKYLSEQLINHKKEYQENRPKPKDKNEEIIAYYEDTIAKEFDKNDEAYEENGTLYVNLDGNPKAIASQKDTTPMIPKLSASKQFIAYQWYDEKNQQYEVIVENLKTRKKEVLKDAISYSWHPSLDMLLYDGSQKDDGHNLLESELYIFQPLVNLIVKLTDTKEFVETSPIFSKDGSSVYCDDAKTGRLLYFNIYSTFYGISNIKQIKIYKTADASMDIEEIKKHSKEFKSIEKDEKFAEKEMTYWIEVELDKDMKSGVYGGHTHPFIFDKNSFTPKQLDVNITKDMVVYLPDDRYGIKFNYQAGVDERRYYFRLNSYTLRFPFVDDLFKIEPMPSHIENTTRETSYYFYKKGFIETILSAIVIGMILMSALYTAVIFSYTRKKEFIYYTLMQVSMAIFLFTAPLFFRGLFSLDFISMRQLTLFVAFFATLFTQSFLDTKKHLPKIDILLNLYLVLIIADAIWIFDPILFKYRLYEFFGLLFLLTAVLRIKEGFRPAWFYLLGWIGLLLCLFLMDFYHFSNFTMFVGVFIEAVMLAWGLVYVSGFRAMSHS